MAKSRSKTSMGDSQFLKTLTLLKNTFGHKMVEGEELQGLERAKKNHIVSTKLLRSPLRMKNLKESLQVSNEKNLTKKGKARKTSV
jgi:hypothetical protein